jgi:hypothetical protein
VPAHRDERRVESDTGKCGEWLNLGYVEKIKILWEGSISAASGSVLSRS